MAGKCCHQREEKRSLSDLAGRLRHHERKLTGPRRAVLDVLRRARQPLGSKDIHAALPAGRCDLVTVYRSLQLLEKLKFVKRFDLGDGVARFELLAEGDDGHHHHLICNHCSRVLELDGCMLAKFDEEIARHSGFRSVSHRLEFFGLCPDCQ
jgi:Fur family ferric uptake transcriptional regulator